MLQKFILPGGVLLPNEHGSLFILLNSFLMIPFSRMVKIDVFRWKTEKINFYVLCFASFSNSNEREKSYQHIDVGSK